MEELKSRGREDYKIVGFDRKAEDADPRMPQSPRERLQFVVEAIYGGVLERIAVYLKCNQSVLVTGATDLAPEIVQGIVTVHGDERDFHQMQFQSSSDKYDERQRPIPQILTHQLTESYKLLRRGHPEGILPIDYLDSIWQFLQPDVQADLHYIIDQSQKAGKCAFLGFADDERNVPPIWRRLFPIVFQIPPPRRDQLWRIFSYREIQDIFGNNAEFTTPAQVCLYYRVATLDLSRIRALIEVLRQTAEKLGPFDSSLLSFLDAAERYLGPDDRHAGNGGSFLVSPKTLAQISRDVINPFLGLYTVETAADVAEIEERIPRGLLLYGPNSFKNQQAARWLADKLQCSLVSTSSASLCQSEHLEGNIVSLLHTARRQAPSIILLEHLDDLTQECSRGVIMAPFLSKWGQIPNSEAVLLVSTARSLDAIPEYLRRYDRFRLAVEINETE